MFVTELHALQKRTSEFGLLDRWQKITIMVNEYCNMVVSGTILVGLFWISLLPMILQVTVASINNLTVLRFNLTRLNDLGGCIM